MNHANKILAFMKAELKKVEKEIYDEDGNLHSEMDAGVIEGMELLISIVGNYIERKEEELSTPLHNEVLLIRNQ